MKLSSRLQATSRELIILMGASLSLGIAFSMFDSIFNNFLNERFSLTGFQRSFLEFPRELPGFTVMFTAALFWFLCNRRLSVLAMVFSAVGAFLIGHASPSYNVMIFWLFLYSLGQHLFMPLSVAIGMELAHEGHAGKRLGQLNAVRNAATILGSFVVFLGFKYLGFTFQLTFTLASVMLILAAVILLMMQPEKTVRKKTQLKLNKEYKLYYILTLLSGSRKQLFVTFAPWVLVTVFGQPTQTLATLLTIGGIIGILFQPFLGWAIDKYGEKLVLSGEAVILVFVCFGYGFAKSTFPENTALLIVFGCYLLDQMLFSVSMARSTFMKKIALRPEDIQPALNAGVTIDHIFSISAALIGGVIWNKYGFQYVFLVGVGIAIANFFFALQIKTPEFVETKISESLAVE